jgi:hypothetical protein
MAKVTHEAGATFLVTLSPSLMDGPTDSPPWRVGSFLKDYEADAADAGVPAIHCLNDYFRRGGHPRFRAARDVYHLNKEGNALIAEHTKQWLMDNQPAPH